MKVAINDLRNAETLAHLLEYENEPACSSRMVDLVARLVPAAESTRR